MSTPDPRCPVSPADIIEVCDRALDSVGCAKYSDLVARIEQLECLAAARFGMLYGLTVDLAQVALNIHRNTEDSLNEAVERASSAAKRSAIALQQLDALPDLSQLPENVSRIAEHPRSRLFKGGTL